MSTIAFGRIEEPGQTAPISIDSRPNFSGADVRHEVPPGHTHLLRYVGKRDTRKDQLSRVGITDAFVAPPTALQAVVAEIRSMIQSGTIRPGTQIVQETLATQLGVSRVPIREALRILEGESLVLYSPRRGYFAAQMDEADLADIYQLRRLLEDEAARLAVSKLTADDLLGIDEALHPLGRIKDGLSFGQQIRAFQFALFEVADSGRLLRTLAQTWDSIDPYRLNLYGEQSDRQAVFALCSELGRAINEKDVDGVLKRLQIGRDAELAQMLD